MKKYLLLSFFVFTIPFTTFASWWNPFTWKIFQKQVTTSSQVETEKETTETTIDDNNSINNKKIDIKTTRLNETKGINIDQGFQFTLSPDNKWIVYFETKYPYYDQYNLMAINTLTKKKYTIDTKDVNTAALHLQLENNCWSQNSKYCVIPVPISQEAVTDDWGLKSYESIHGTKNIPFLTGKLYTKSQFAIKGKSVGYLNNGPDIIIDFSNEHVGPQIKKQFFDSFFGDYSSKGHIGEYPQNRITFESLSENGFSCSDCQNTMVDKDYGNNKHGAELVSPNKQYIARTISTGSGWVTPPKLYIEDLKNKTIQFIAPNVYFRMHFTSDSKRLYYYGCYQGGGCSEKDSLSYVDLTPNPYPNEKQSIVSNQNPLHTQEERQRDLEIIRKKQKDEQTAILKSHYELLLNEFKNPQKIIGSNGSRIYTQNYRMIRFVDESQGWNYEKSMKATALVKSLIGQTVTISLPTFDDFIKTYQDEDDYETFHNNYNIWVYDAQGKEVLHVPAPIDPIYKKYIGLVYANVYFNNKLLNDEFK